MKKNNRKYFILILVALMVFGAFNLGFLKAEIKAEPTIQITSDSLDMYEKNADGNMSILSIGGNNQKFKKGDFYLIKDQFVDESNVKWYMVDYLNNGKKYKVFAKASGVYELDTEWEQLMIDQGFSYDYIVKLRELHKIHPTWNFIGYKTKIKWTTMLDKEDVLRKNLINGSDTSLRSKMAGAYDSSTGKYIPLDGTSWYQASRDTIAYYLDPRNFLNDKNIFMFLQLSFNENESIDLVQKILNGTFMQNKDYVDEISYSSIFYEAGKKAKVSPIYLATLARQEIGTSASNRTITGGTFDYNGKTYAGLYNFYNIGATSGTDNWKKGLVYANGGEDGSATSYGRPWTSPKKAIEGGALWIAGGYISKGQDTMYFQKFNCTTYSTYGHQYMTNVRAAYSQSGTMYNTYNNNNALDSELNFKIPIYLDMPNSLERPTFPNVDNLLYANEVIIPDNPGKPNVDPVDDPTVNPGSDTTPENPGQNDNNNNNNNNPDTPVLPPIVNGVTEVSDLLASMNLVQKDNFVSGFKSGMTLQQIKNSISSTGFTVKLIVDGKEMSNNTKLATGQTLVISDGNKNTEITVIIKGDIDGNGEIDTMDYLLYRKALLQEYKMNSTEIQAGILGGEDSDISTLGYLIIRKYLLGEGSIE